VGVGVSTWGEFAAQEPELAAFRAERLRAAPAYVATIRSNGAPRVHPVTPILTTDGLFLFMEPTSPKGHDLRARAWYALHSGVPDSQGSGGEFFVSGRGFAVEDPAVRALVAEAASYDPAAQYVLFELTLTDARCNGYGDVPLPARQRWSGAS
jgi:hypothetical protein